MSDTFTYTTARMGARTRDGKIVKCSKCGRKGALRVMGHDQDGKVWHDQVIHGGETLSGGPMLARHISDSCLLPFTPEQQVERDAWEAAYKATHRASAARLAAQEALAQYRAQHAQQTQPEVTRG